MKLSFIPAIISLLITALICYGINTYCNNIALSQLVTIGSIITIGIPMLFMMGVKFDDNRKKINIAILSALFVAVFLGSNLFFAFSLLSTETGYIITNGILALIYLLIVYGISKQK